MPRTMNIPRGSEGGVALAAAPAPAPAPASAPAPGPNNGGLAGGARASRGATPIIKKEEEEEETLGQLLDRLAPGLTRVPGPRATFVHIKVEDSSSGDDTDGEGGLGGGEEATGRKGDGEEEQGDEEEQEREEQREQRAQAPGPNFEGRINAGADEVAPPRRSRPPPGSYADTTVDYDEEEEDEDEDEEEE
jgi:hypothetical protein